MGLPPIRTLSVCSGIGGLDLGVTLACGATHPIVYVERDIQTADILARRIEEGFLEPAPIWSDLTTFDARSLVGKVDLFLGGFPCQDVSLAGKGRGLVQGTRTGLWFECARVIREAQPGWVFLENVGGLVRRGLARVLQDLAGMGFDAEWDLFTASETGAPHKRERLFILARRISDSECNPVREESRRGSGCGDWSSAAELKHMGHGDSERSERTGEARYRRGGLEDSGGKVANAECLGELQQEGGQQKQWGWGLYSGHADSLDLWPPGPVDDWSRIPAEAQPAIRGVANGLPARNDRLRTLGNGVVPLVAAYALRTLEARMR